MKKLTTKNINTPERYNEIYDEDKRLVDYSISKELKEKRKTLSIKIKDGMKVVELGCGNSDLLSNIKKKYPNCDVYGLDFSKAVIENMYKHFSDITYDIGNALKTPYADNIFDVVMAGELIEHVEDPNSLLKEMVRICKKNGVISISTPFEETTWRSALKEHIWEFDKQDMIDLFSKYGEPEISLIIENKKHMVVNCKLT